MALLASRPPNDAAISGVRNGEAVAAAPAPATFGFKGMGWTGLVRQDTSVAFASILALRQIVAAAVDILTKRNWESADLAELVLSVLASYRTSDADRIQVDGPEVRLRPKAALALSTALFELATNAAKYGAFSQDSGRLDVTWTIAEDHFELEWRESGGPLVAAPHRVGFGSRLIKQGLAAELGGQTTTEYPQTGLNFKFQAPLSAMQGSA